MALRSYLLASFHSDSSGLSTMPVLAALHQLAISRYPNHRLVFGLDANTVSQRPEPGSKDHGHSPHDFFQRTRSCHNFWRTSNVCMANSTTGLHAYFTDLGMSSCWGEKGHETAWTTCLARTFLQPQLQKAVRMADTFSENHCNLKVLSPPFPPCHQNTPHPAW